jgi:hypothetical protein
MFAYQPTQSRAGEYYAQNQLAAAQAMAQAQMEASRINAATMAQIGESLASIGEMYGEIESQKAKGRAFKDVFKVVSPSLGISMEQLEGVAGGKIKRDRDWYQVSEMMGPMMPSLINMQLGKDRLGVQQNQQALNSPGARALVSNQQDVINQGGNQIQGARWQRNP